MYALVGSRNYDKTNANERSSRSHTIFKITIESRLIRDEEEGDGTIKVASLVSVYLMIKWDHNDYFGAQTLLPWPLVNTQSCSTQGTITYFAWPLTIRHTYIRGNLRMYGHFSAALDTSVFLGLIVPLKDDDRW